MRAAVTWIAFSLGCAEDAAPRDPCARATCSGHGTCVASGPNAHCECEPGWEAVGLACIESSPCDPDAGPAEVAWQIDTAASGAGQSQVPSVAIDSAGAVHVALHHVADGLVHASDETGEWLANIAGIRHNEEGQAPSIAIDGDDVVRIACRSSAQIVHFVREKEWSFTVVDAAGGHGTSLAVGPDGSSHVAYEDATGHVAYARATPGWVVEQVEPERPGTSPSIAVDSEGLVHLAYAPIVAGRPEGVRYGTREGDGWTFVTVDDVGGEGARPALALQPNDEAAVVFGRYAKGELYLARETDGWVPEVVVDTGFGIGSPALVFDTEGLAHVVFLNVALGPAMALASQDDGDWRIDPVEDGALGGFTSIAAAPDFVALVYRGDAAGAVHVARTDLPIAADPGDDCE